MFFRSYSCARLISIDDIDQSELDGLAYCFAGNNKHKHPNKRKKVVYELARSYILDEVGSTNERTRAGPECMCGYN
jgi:hypothetical protein